MIYSQFQKISKLFKKKYWINKIKQICLKKNATFYNKKQIFIKANWISRIITNRK